jgi:hypothetical protein
VGPDADPADQVRAIAALGALRRPILAMPSMDATDLEVVLEAAMAALVETSESELPRRRQPLRPRPRRW